MCSTWGSGQRKEEEAVFGETGRAVRLGRGSRVYKSQAGMVGMSIGPVMQAYEILQFRTGQRPEQLFWGQVKTHLSEGPLCPTRCSNNLIKKPMKGRVQGVHKSMWTLSGMYFIHLFLQKSLAESLAHSRFSFVFFNYRISQ